jgi:hypothetical protein
MANTPTTRGRYQKQATGDNFGSWGVEQNAGTIDMIDEAVHGVEPITINGDATLTSTNYVSDQARNRVFRLVIGSATAAFTLTLPAVEDWHFVDNTTAYDATIKPASGTGAVVRAGRKAWVYTDGSVLYVNDPALSDLRAAIASVDFGSQKGINLATGTANTDAVNKAQMDALKLSDLNAPAASVSMGSQKITSLATGTATTDAVNKAQMDTALSGVVAGTYDLTPYSKIDGTRDFTAPVNGVAPAAGASSAALVTAAWTQTEIKKFALCAAVLL